MSKCHEPEFIFQPSPRTDAHPYDGNGSRAIERRELEKNHIKAIIVCYGKISSNTLEFYYGLCAKFVFFFHRRCSDLRAKERGRERENTLRPFNIWKGAGWWMGFVQSRITESFESRKSAPWFDSDHVGCYEFAPCHKYSKRLWLSVRLSSCHII